MKKILCACGLVLGLAACGVDGEPITPTANVNVGVGSSGVNAGVNLGLKQGKWALNLGRAL
ncbi:MAG: hypothetical protein AB8B71_00765 [Paracoccaceae bacterium]